MYSVDSGKRCNMNLRISDMVSQLKSNSARQFVIMTLGTVLLTAGVYFFKIPNGFSTGGVSGIGTILGSITGAKTVYCSMLFSALTWILEDVFPMSAPFTDDSFLELIYAMLLTSIGAAMIFNSNASSGGTDIVALILKKYTRTDVGRALLAADFTVAAASFFVFSVKIGLYSMLGLFMKAFLVDSVIESLNSCKYFVVITTHGEEIAQYILKEIHHGATVTDAVGGYTHEKKQMVHTVCKRIEAIKLRAKVVSIDPHAFVIVSTSSDIIGRGFRSV